MNKPSLKESEKVVVNIYACGGAGINMAFLLDKMPFLSKDGYASMNLIYVDTTMANLRGRKVFEDQPYIIGGRDGSGGIRSENNVSISESMDDLLLQHPAARYNIVLSSVAGGSGSVISPNLIGKLLEEDALVVGIVIGDMATSTFTNNTIKTIESFSGVVSKYSKKTLPLTVVLNHPTRTRTSVDKAVCLHVAYYLALFSETLMALDYSDVYNWVHQERVTNIAAPLTMVSAYFSDPLGEQLMDTSIADAEQIDFESVATTLTMIANQDDTPLSSTDFPQHYVTTGQALHDYTDLGLPGNLNLVAHNNVTDFYGRITEMSAVTQKRFKARRPVGAKVIQVPTSSDGMSY